MEDPGSTITISYMGIPFTFHNGVWATTHPGMEPLLENLRGRTGPIMRHDTSMYWVKKVLEALNLSEDCIIDDHMDYPKTTRTKSNRHRRSRKHYHD